MRNPDRPSFEQERLEQLFDEVTLGHEILDALEGKQKYPIFLTLLGAARDAAHQHLREMIKIDLYMPGSLARMRSSQAEVRRYVDICRWITAGLINFQAAEAQLDENYEPDEVVKKLKDIMYGQAANDTENPAPDA